MVQDGASHSADPTPARSTTSQPRAFEKLEDFEVHGIHDYEELYICDDIPYIVLFLDIGIEIDAGDYFIFTYDVSGNL